MKYTTQLITIIFSALLLLGACQPLDAIDVNTTNQTDNESLFSPLPEIVENSSLNITTNQTEIPTKIVKEGEVVRINKDAVKDDDGDTIVFSFPEPFNNDGVWQTQIGDTGEYIFPINFTDGDFKVTTLIRVIVEQINTPPTILNVQDIVLFEGETIVIEPKVSDREQQKTNVKISGYLNEFRKSTTFGDAGEYSATITADDGILSANKTIKITILKQDRPPVLQPIAAQQVTVGQTLQLSPTATHPDNKTVTFIYSSPFDLTGRFTPTENDVGTIRANVTATDGKLSDVQSVIITVLRANRPPIINAPSPQVTQEGASFTLNVTVTDPDQDAVVVTYRGFMTNKTRMIAFGEEGEHTVTVTAADGTHSTTKQITVIVEKTNRPPEFRGDIFG